MTSWTAFGPYWKVGGGNPRNRSRHDLVEPTAFDAPPDLHRDPSPRTHRTAPERVPVRVAHRHVDVRPAADTRRHVVDPELQVFVDRGLEGERSDDPRSEVFLRRPDVPFGDVEDRREAGLPEGRRVVSDDDVFGNALGLGERHLLIGRQSHVSVRGRLARSGPWPGPAPR